MKQLKNHSLKLVGGCVASEYILALSEAESSGGRQTDIQPQLINSSTYMNSGIL